MGETLYRNLKYHWVQASRPMCCELLVGGNASVGTGVLVCSCTWDGFC